MVKKSNLTVLFFINPSLIGGMASNARRTGLLVVERGGEIYYRKELLQFLLKRSKNKVVIIYATSNLRRLVLIIFFRILGIKVVTRVGGKRIMSSSQFSTKIVCLITNVVIVVNQELFSFLKTLSVDKSKLYHLPGFIPPLIESAYTERFDLSFTYMYTESDIYNLESIESISKLGYSTLIGVYGLPVDLMNELAKQKLTELSKLPSVQMIENDNDFLGKAINANLHIRMTREDGDSNIIRELLYFKRKVVASSVVMRPPGCLVHDLTDKIDRVKINEWLSADIDFPNEPLVDQLEYIPKLFPHDFKS